MKRLVLFLSLTLTLTACFDDIKTDKDQNSYVNRWIYEYMSSVYYWNKEMPSYKASYDNPATYFSTLINSEDRFSAIYESYQEISDRLNGITNSEVGFEFQLFRENANNNKVVGVVLYLKPGTPAATLGINRGDFFTKINGTEINMNNYNELIASFYDATTEVTVTFVEYSEGVIVNQKPFTIVKANHYKENPIYLDTIYTMQYKKIGYIVYNFFTADPGDETKCYDLKLNNIMAEFNQENITDLVVDLRYNSGGMMSSAINLASMLVPDLSSEKVFIYTEYNQNYTDYFHSSAFKNKYNYNPFADNFTTSIDVKSPSSQTYPLQNVGGKLQQIYFLTGRNTASASEMVINGLKPFINCALIGDTTVGKNVGSILVKDEENKKNQWAIMPIILKYFNYDHQSDFTNGFVPHYRIRDNFAYPLGDTRDALLAKAIEQITGIQQIAPHSKRIPEAKVPITGSDLYFMQRGLILNNKNIP